jgi:hypothetical protein
MTHLGYWMFSVLFFYMLGDHVVDADIQIGTKTYLKKVTLVVVETSVIGYEYCGTYLTQLSLILHTCKQYILYIYYILGEIVIHTPCGGGVDYLHRNPANRRRRRKVNPVPGSITGPSCSRGILIRGPGPPGGGVSNLRQ